MKNQELKQADTRKTTSLIKKFLKEEFSINAKVKSEKYSGGSSIRISYMAGPESDKIESVLSGLKMGSFNGMEDIYEYNNNNALVIYGYKLEQYKFCFIDREIPEPMKVKMCEIISDKMKFDGVHDFDGDLHKYFEERFGSSSTWSQLLFREANDINFINDDVDNIDIIDVESHSGGLGLNLVFTYTYAGKEYKTIKGKSETNNNELNADEMKKENYEIGQMVKVSYKNGTDYTGSITKVTEKTIRVDVDGKLKQVMLSTANVEVISKEENEKPVDTSKEVGPKEEKAPLSFYGYMLELEKTIKIDDQSMEAAKSVVLNSKGTKKLVSVKKQYEEKKIDYKRLFEELKDIATNCAKKPLKSSNKAKETNEKTDSIIDMISNIDSDKEFNQVLKVVEEKGIKFVSKKSNFNMELTKFESGNIYVFCTNNKRTYYSTSSRFGVHFKVK